HINLPPPDMPRLSQLFCTRPFSGHDPEINLAGSGGSFPLSAATPRWLSKFDAGSQRVVFMSAPPDCSSTLNNCGPTIFAVDATSDLIYGWGYASNVQQITPTAAQLTCTQPGSNQIYRTPEIGYENPVPSPDGRYIAVHRTVHELFYNAQTQSCEE